MAPHAARLDLSVLLLALNPDDMRRVLFNVLAGIGALTVAGAATGFAVRSIADSGASGVVLGLNDQPLAAVPVYLDRGSVAIERFVTDADGRFYLPLEAREHNRATWLICAPGGIPMVGTHRARSVGPTTYLYTALADSTWGFYRANGWRGPVPRACPAGTDSMGWRYPASAGRHPSAFTTQEPDWDP